QQLDDGAIARTVEEDDVDLRALVGLGRLLERPLLRPGRCADGRGGECERTDRSMREQFHERLPWLLSFGKMMLLTMPGVSSACRRKASGASSSVKRWLISAFTSTFPVATS